MSKVSREAAGKHRRCGFANGADELWGFTNVQNLVYCMVMFEFFRLRKASKHTWNNMRLRVGIR